MIEIGKKAPAFTLASDGDDRVSLSDFAGKPVVLYFYPRDNTPGCTREAIEFSKSNAAFAAAGAKVLGVSRDSIASHAKFRDQHDLTITLLSDPDLKVHKAYGAFGEKVLYGKKTEGVIRSTFVIGADGKIAKVYPSVKVDGHAEKVLAAITGEEPVAAPKKAPAAKKAAPAKKAAAPAKKVAAKKK